MDSSDQDSRERCIFGARSGRTRKISIRSAVLARAYMPACLLLLSLACSRKGEVEPVALLAEDVCANCKMAISQRAFAAEILDREQIAVKFDDIGCLVRYISKRGKKEDVTAWFVMDYASKTWMDATKAWYVRSSSIRTPMGSGILAFREKSRAESAAAQAGLQVQVFSEIVP